MTNVRVAALLLIDGDVRRRTAERHEPPKRLNKKRSRSANERNLALRQTFDHRYAHRSTRFAFPLIGTMHYERTRTDCPSPQGKPVNQTRTLEAIGTPLAITGIAPGKRNQRNSLSRQERS